MRPHRPALDLTACLEEILVDLCRTLPEFAHIDPARLLVCLAKARTRGPGGVYAKIIPQRFADGSPFKTVKGHRYALPQIPTPRGDVLYLIYVYTPRFFEQPFERRVLTLIHELYHIAPAFDGTLRRIGQRAHGASREQFNDNLQPLVERYLVAAPVSDAMTVLRESLQELSRRATLVGRTLPVPKAVRLPDSTKPQEKTSCL